MSAHSASKEAKKLVIGVLLLCAALNPAPPKDTTREMRAFNDYCDWRPARSALIPRLAGENVFVDLGWIAEHDEANVAHILLRDALHVGGCDRAQFGDGLE